MVVLEELDANKKGLSEASRNVRQGEPLPRRPDARRHQGPDRCRSAAAVARGIGQRTDIGPAPAAGRPPLAAGRLFFQTRQLSSALPDYLPGHGADNAILSQTLALQALHHEARHAGVQGHQPAHQGCGGRRPRRGLLQRQTIEDADVLYTGLAPCRRNFWERHGKDMRSWKEAERTYYEISGPVVTDLHVNQFVHEDSASGIEAIVRRIEAGKATLELARDYRTERHSIWGVNARNREQNFALNLLMDTEIDFVTILGPAGTGKTLLTLAAGLMQTLESNRFVEIIMTRVTIPLGEDIGFLPGTEEEKMARMGALMDNSVAHAHREGGNWGRAATNDLLRTHQDSLAELHRGRTFSTGS
jgi:PhoH-like ATPase